MQRYNKYTYKKYQACLISTTQPVKKLESTNLSHWAQLCEIHGFTPSRDLTINIEVKVYRNRLGEQLEVRAARWPSLTASNVSAEWQKLDSQRRYAKGCHFGVAEDLLMTHAATDQESLHRFQEKGVDVNHASHKLAKTKQAGLKRNHYHSE